MQRTLVTVPPAISMVALIGTHDDNLRIVEAAFPSVAITVRGNEITLRGPHAECGQVEKLIAELLVVIRSGQVLTTDAISRSIAMLSQEPQEHPAEVLSLNIVSNRGRTIRPKTANQKRGRTLNDAFVILDEAQNTTPEQMKMFLTRLGFGSKMVVTGDITQVDLPNSAQSGLRIVRNILNDIDDIAFLELTAEDVVRHRLIGDIVTAYATFDETKQVPRPIRNS